MSWLLVALAVWLVPLHIPLGHESRRGTARSFELPANKVGAVAVAAVCVLLLPAPMSFAVAAGAAAVGWRLLPRTLARPDADAALQLSRSLPEACSLLSGLIRSGCTDQEALARTAGVVDGSLSRELSDVARMRRMGATAQEAWKPVDEDPGVRALAAIMMRRSETGSGVASELERLASDLRSDYFTRAQAAARSAAVRSVIPLAVCFLPAFLLLGVAPIVAALTTSLSF